MEAPSTGKSVLSKVLLRQIMLQREVKASTPEHPAFQSHTRGAHGFVLRRKPLVRCGFGNDLVPRNVQGRAIVPPQPSRSKVLFRIQWNSDTGCSFMDHTRNIYDSLANHVSPTREAVLLEELSGARRERVG
jgi:hypothetical protein